MRTAKAKPASNDALRKGIRAIAPVFATAIVFSFFINLLLFVSPLYMLQIYDRVLGTRNLVTLGGLTIIAGVLLLVWAALELCVLAYLFAPDYCSTNGLQLQCSGSSTGVCCANRIQSILNIFVMST